MNTEPNPLNIPAYQRKRSINAKARKKPAYLETALDRARARSAQKRRAKRDGHLRPKGEARPPKAWHRGGIEQKNKKTNSTRKSASPRQPNYQKSSSYPSPIFAEIPIQSPLLPSQQIFPNPFDDMAAPKKSAFREMKICGVCEGYFDKIEVAIVKVTSPIRVGDSIIFEKQEGLFEQQVKSMQIDRKDITLATTGSEIGLKVYQKPTVGAPVYKVIE